MAAEPEPREAAGETVTGEAPAGGAAPGVHRNALWLRTTARPEGGGRAAGRDASAPARQWPILVVIGGVVLGLVLTAADHFRAGAILIGAALLLGGAMRFTLPSVGMLAVRSRFTDVITYLVLGTAIVLLALMAQPDPILDVPFLEDIIRFSVR